MADILISKFTTQIPRVGAIPATPGFAESEGQNPVAPSGSPLVYTPVTIGSPANGLSIDGSQVLTIGLASTSATGALSSTDWNTFNGKIGGTIASGQVAFGTGVNTVGGDAGLTWDNTLKTLTVSTTGGTIRPLNLNFLNGTSFVGNNVGEFVFNVLQVTSNAGSASFQPRNNGTASGSFVTYSTLEGGTLFGLSRANFTALIQSGGSGLMVGVTTAHPLIFGSNNLERARFLSTGEFGINTTTPSNTLDVNGTSIIRGILTVGNGTDSIIRANSSISGTTQITIIQASTSNNNTMIDIRPATGNTTMAGFYLRDSATAATSTNTMILGRGNATLPDVNVSYLGNIVNGLTNANSFNIGFLVSNTTSGRFEAVRIMNSGLVGIATTSPTNTLDVNGTARIRTINNLGSAATSVLVPSATGVLSLRTLAELASDGLGSKWTDVTGGIFRNGAVAVGRTTIPTNATFAVQSLTATGTHQFFQLLNNAGSVLASLTQNGDFAINTTPVTDTKLIVRAPTDNATGAGLQINNLSGSSIFQVTGATVRSNGFTGINRLESEIALGVQARASATIAIRVYDNAGSRTVDIVGSTGNYQSAGGAFFGISNTTAPTGRVDIRGIGTTTNTTLLLEDSAGTDNAIFLDNGQIRFLRLPTSSAGLAAGSLWNNGGVLNIV